MHSKIKHICYNMARTPSLWKFREGWGDIINQEHSTKQTLIFELVSWNLKICGFLMFFDFSTFRILLPLFDFSDFSTFAATFRLFGLFDFSSFAATFRLFGLFDFCCHFSTFRLFEFCCHFSTFWLFEFFSIVLTLDPECIRVVPQKVHHFPKKTQDSWGATKKPR